MARRRRLVLGEDYLIDPDGAVVLTRQYLLSQGSCCGNNCRYCPYQARPAHVSKPAQVQIEAVSPRRPHRR